MQAASLCFTAPFTPKNTKNLVPRQLPAAPRRTTNARPTVVFAAVPAENSTVDYSSSSSVFPAEACETIGGEACEVEMFPEAKLAQATTGSKTGAVEDVEREYLEYSESKTVFPGEACDELGGEFCEPEYQQGVYEEKKSK